MSDKPKLCYGCDHLTSRWYGDGTTNYGCALSPGLVTGSASALDGPDEPQACDKHTKILKEPRT